MRPIDADALKDEIRKYANEPSKIRDRRWDVRCTAIIADMNGLINKAPTIGGWISVEDRLPEVGKVVLAFGTRSATTGMFQGVSVRNDLWYWKGHTIKHVSHWMPLPSTEGLDET